MKQPAQLGSAFALFQAGKPDQAETALQGILEQAPNQFDALHLLGVIKAQTKQYEQALQLLDKALSLQAGNAELRKNHRAVLELHLDFQIKQAVALHQQERLSEAHDIYVAILQRAPDHFDALQLLGALAGKRNDPRLALDYLQRALIIKPDFAEAHNNKGNALKELQRLDEALASYNQAIALKPDYADAYGNKGVVLNELKRFEEALACCDRAIMLNPGYAEAHCARGVALKELKRFEHALASYRQAIALKPDHAEAHFNLSLAHLLQGDYAAGWEKYEWRWTRRGYEKNRHADLPLWSGKESISGRTLLLWSEQGLGDTLQFCRYAQSPAALGATVILEAPPGLVSTLRGLAGVSQVITVGSPLPAIDLQCPLLSLPLALNINLADLSGRAYLPAPQRAAGDAALDARRHKRVGVVWSGNASHQNDAIRSIPLSTFVACLPENIEIVCLQKEIRASDQSTLARYPAIQVLSERLSDFSDTAALIDTLDLVVTVDTSVAHLAGAMGKAVWVLLPWVPDWRWLLDREDSPWYDSARLFRQPKMQDWASVMQQVRSQLCERYGMDQSLPGPID